MQYNLLEMVLHTRKNREYFFLDRICNKCYHIEGCFVGNMSEMEQFLIHAKTEKKA